MAGVRFVVLIEGGLDVDVVLLLAGASARAGGSALARGVDVADHACERAEDEHAEGGVNVLALRLQVDKEVAVACCQAVGDTIEVPDRGLGHHAVKIQVLNDQWVDLLGLVDEDLIGIHLRDGSGPLLTFIPNISLVAPVAQEYENLRHISVLVLEGLHILHQVVVACAWLVSLPLVQLAHGLAVEQGQPTIRSANYQDERALDLHEVSAIARMRGVSVILPPNFYGGGAFVLNDSSLGHLEPAAEEPRPLRERIHAVLPWRIVLQINVESKGSYLVILV